MGAGAARCTLCSDTQRLHHEIGEINYGERSGTARATEKPNITRPPVPARPSNEERSGLQDTPRGPDPMVPPQCAVENTSISRGGGIVKRGFAEAPPPMPTASRHEPEDSPEVPFDPNVPMVEGQAPKHNGAAPVRSADQVITSAPIAPICPPRLSASPVVVPEVVATAPVVAADSGETVLASTLPSLVNPVSLPESRTPFAGAADQQIACAPLASPSDVLKPATAVALTPEHPSALAEAVPAGQARDAPMPPLAVDLSFLDLLVTRLEDSAARFGAAPMSAAAIGVDTRQRGIVSGYAVDLGALDELVQRLERAAERLDARRQNA